MGTGTLTTLAFSLGLRGSEGASKMAEEDRKAMVSYVCLGRQRERLPDGVVRVGRKDAEEVWWGCWVSGFERQLRID